MSRDDPRKKNRQTTLEMSIQDFELLPFDEKTTFLWDQGVCLNQRIVDQHEIICIFSVEDFYVEAVYCRDNNCVVGISTLNDHSSWEVYVELVLRDLVPLDDGSCY